MAVRSPKTPSAEPPYGPCSYKRLELQHPTLRSRCSSDCGDAWQEYCERECLGAHAQGGAEAPGPHLVLKHEAAVHEPLDLAATPLEERFLRFRKVANFEGITQTSRKARTI